MGMLFNFKAYKIRTSIPENFQTGNATIVISQSPVADPISDTVNNVRFSVNGFATDGAFASVEIRSRSYFKFQLPEAGQITVHGHFMYAGTASAAATAGIPVIDISGMGAFKIFGRMRLRVYDRNGTRVLSRSSSEELLGRVSAIGGYAPFEGGESDSGIIAAGLLERFHTLVSPDAVQPSDTVYVRMQYFVQAFAIDGGEFVADFDGSGGQGLNVPMVVLNY